MALPTWPNLPARSAGSLNFLERSSVWYPSSARAATLTAAFGLGALALLPTFRELVQMWQADALRSVGALLVLLAIPLIVWCWAQVGWESRGSWWGLPLVLAAAALSRITAGGVLSYTTSGGFSVGLLQPGLLLLGMGVGIVLLLGGVRLLRAAIFPLCLLLLANPVPHSFNRYVDLPLQQFSAEAARRFSHLLGLHPAGKDLLMMFTPHFGMMIVPGCNGIRGGVTMGYLAIVLGWLEGFRPRKIAFCAMGAVALGYVMNLLRLCLLVVYYWAGVHHPGWQHHGAAVDYCIGGTLFFLTAALFSGIFFHPLKRVWHNAYWKPQPFRSHTALAVLALLAILGGAQLYAQRGHLSFQPDYVPWTQATSALPPEVGGWSLQRTWGETDGSGRPVWIWGEYVRAGTEHPIRLGLWLSPLEHFALSSERSHGRVALWTGALDSSDANGLPLHFSTFASGEGETPESVAYTAETKCRADGCAATVSGFKRKGVSFAFGKPGEGRRLQMVLRIQGVATRDGDATAAEFAKHLNTIRMLDLAGTE